jgi:hypothetical protein
MLWTIDDLNKRVTPYELATLASRIYPERLGLDPDPALNDTLEILRFAVAIIRRDAGEERKVAQETEEEERAYHTKSEDWAKGVKEITGEHRRDRAERKLTEFMKHASPGNLAGYMRDGFTPNEIHNLRRKFAEWKKQPKGKQGRRLSEHDGRLRVGSFALLPKKPRKQS